MSFVDERRRALELGGDHEGGVAATGARVDSDTYTSSYRTIGFAPMSGPVGAAAGGCVVDKTSAAGSIRPTRREGLSNANSPLLAIMAMAAVMKVTAMTPAVIQACRRFMKSTIRMVQFGDGQLIVMVGPVHLPVG